MVVSLWLVSSASAPSVFSVSGLSIDRPPEYAHEVALDNSALESMRDIVSRERPDIVLCMLPAKPTQFYGGCSFSSSFMLHWEDQLV